MNHYKHITIEERENLLRLSSEGKKIREIAEKIGRAPSIRRELKRNKKQKEKYSPSKAQFRYRQRRKRCGRKRKLKEAEAKKLVRHLFLDLQWSHEQISNRLKMEKLEGNRDIYVKHVDVII